MRCEDEFAGAPNTILDACSLAAPIAMRAASPPKPTRRDSGVDGTSRSFIEAGLTGGAVAVTGMSTSSANENPILSGLGWGGGGSREL